jgi:hypothetical protein
VEISMEEGGEGQDRGSSGRGGGSDTASLLTRAEMAVRQLLAAARAQGRPQRPEGSIEWAYAR